MMLKACKTCHQAYTGDFCAWCQLGAAKPSEVFEPNYPCPKCGTRLAFTPPKPVPFRDPAAPAAEAFEAARSLVLLLLARKPVVTTADVLAIGNPFDGRNGFDRDAQDRDAIIDAASREQAPADFRWSALCRRCNQPEAHSWHEPGDLRSHDFEHPAEE